MCEAYQGQKHLNKIQKCNVEVQIHLIVRIKKTKDGGMSSMGYTGTNLVPFTMLICP